MRFTTTIKLVLADAPSSSLANVKVCLFDRDRFTPDDLLGTAVTDGNGEARFQYSSEDFLDVDEKTGGEFPELYAVVYDGEDDVVVSTRSEADSNAAHKRITVPIARDLAQRHRLLTAG